MPEREAARLIVELRRRDAEIRDQPVEQRCVLAREQLTEIAEAAVHVVHAIPEALDSSRLVRAPNSPVTGRRRSFSKRSIA